MNELLRKAQGQQAVLAAVGGANMAQDYNSVMGNVTMSNTVGANYMNATTVSR